MTNTELMTYRRQLLALRSRLNTDVSDLADEALGKPGDEASVNLSHAPIHTADQGSDSFEQQFTLSLMENEERTLGEIAAALGRIAQGTFGCCEECQQPILPARLEALPYTCYCIGCARKLQGQAAQR